MNEEDLIKIIEAEVKKVLSDKLTRQEGVKQDVAPSYKTCITAIILAGFEDRSDIADQLRTLFKGEYTITAILPLKAFDETKLSKLKSTLGLSRLIDDSERCVSAEEIVDASEAIVIPVPTLGLIAKVALGIIDNLSTEVVITALAKRKKVISSKKILAFSGQRTVNNVPQALTDVINDYMKKLESFGMTFTDISGMAQYIARTEDIGRLDKEKIVSQELIQNLPDGVRQIVLKRGAIVTPLAKDTAREMGIEIVFE